jgi:amino acid transporter
MEIIIQVTNFLILGLILALPIFILFKLKQSLVVYSLTTLIILGVIIWIFAWWSDKSALILLDHYGFNSNGFNDTERFQNVTQENIDKVKSLETSIMGIGWPLKAIFGFLMTIPYLIFVYIVKVLIDRIKKKKNEA